MPKEDFLDEIIQSYPGIHSIKKHIGTRLASNYAMGTRNNSSYKLRLGSGIDVGLKTP